MTRDTFSLGRAYEFVRIYFLAIRFFIQGAYVMVRPWKAGNYLRNR